MAMPELIPHQAYCFRTNNKKRYIGKKYKGGLHVFEGEDGSLSFWDEETLRNIPITKWPRDFWYLTGEKVDEVYSLERLARREFQQRIDREESCELINL